ncbi:hypothetical protein ABW20_dc0100296 [Dactylellina cionopaga]|nr:hypothetical protein ABW20_dc0100296 [Dactylellina cionopaga]
MTISKDPAFKSKEVYFIAHVSEVHTAPTIVLYADPWQQYLENLISLESRSYRVRTSKSAGTILTYTSGDLEFADKTEEIYKDLNVGTNQIRLLKLNLLDDDAPLSGILEVTDIDTATDFWAISYVWGPKPTPLSPYYFHTNQGNIAITESLATCLMYLRRYLRLHRINVLIWADALCINQKNGYEKGMQVRRMGALYSHAKRVVIWMGREKPEDCQAIDILTRMQENPEGLRNDPNVMFYHVEAFLRRDWFTRTWVIQEIVFAKADVRVACGNSEIEWDAMIQGILNYENLFLNGDQTIAKGERVYLKYSGFARAFDRIRQDFKTPGTENNLLDLLELFHYTRSSRSRDKLFALLNLADDISIDEELFIPDYESTDEVILARAGWAKASKTCSWVPNFMSNWKGTERPTTVSQWKIYPWEKFDAGFSAGGDDDPIGNIYCEKDEDQPVLNITGVHIDTIKQLKRIKLDTSSGIPSFSDVLADLLDCMPDEPSRLYAQYGENWRDEVLFQTLIGEALGPQPISSWPFFEQSDMVMPEEWPAGFKETVFRSRNTGLQSGILPEEYQKPRYAPQKED